MTRTISFVLLLTIVLIAVPMISMGQTDTVKWTQPPQRIGNYLGMPLFLGWDQLSAAKTGTIGEYAADDWRCSGDRPVTDIHWWGSFIGWMETPPALPLIVPDGFRIRIYKNIPAGIPPYSRPGDQVAEYNLAASEVVSKFAGYDFDPHINGVADVTYSYSWTIPDGQWFLQDPDDNIYWLSIQALYSNLVPGKYQWGWKTRPHYYSDDAVLHNDTLYQWKPMEPGWDMAFELTTVPRKVAKWDQPPVFVDPSAARPMILGWDQPSLIVQNSQATVVRLADDWLCGNPEPISDVHWWGSYVGWMQSVSPEIRPAGFQLDILKDVPAGVDTDYSHPGEAVWSYYADFSSTNEKFVGYDRFPTGTDISDSTFYYSVYLPQGSYFTQDPAANAIFWLSITPVYIGPMASQAVPIDFPWGWKTRVKNFMDDAVRFSPVSYFWEPVMPGWDFAFQLSTGSQVSVKWMQEPMQIGMYQQMPLYQGWDQVASDMYGSENNVLADDWPCQTADQINHITWWGSYLNWLEPVPANMPDVWHLRIYSDHPADPTSPNNYSYPLDLKWEYYAYMDQVIANFVGFDEDPFGGGVDSTFRYDLELPAYAWFNQGPGQNIYWLSIEGLYFNGMPAYPWGWKTRPHMFMDSAVLRGTFLPGWTPIRPGWDLCFALNGVSDRSKWDQPPITSGEIFNGMPVYSGWDEPGVIPPVVYPVVADDWKCRTKSEVTAIEWWGSYPGYLEPVPPILSMFYPYGFDIRIYSDVPVGPDNPYGYSYPGALQWEYVTYNGQYTEQFAGFDTMDTMPPYAMQDSCFNYKLYLPNVAHFLQPNPSEIFWISIAALYFNDPGSPGWGWKTRPLVWNDTAVWSTMFDPGWTPLPYRLDHPWDTSFRLWTDAPGINLSGKITLADYVGDLSIMPITVKLRDPVSGDVLRSETFTLATNPGNYTIFDVIPGTYDVMFECMPHWLRHVDYSQMIVADTTIDVSLTNGDIDGDNEVTSTDLSILGLALGSTPGDPNWDPAADIDGDGEVTSTDLSILGLALGLMGDE